MAVLVLDGLLYVRAGLIGVSVSPRQHDVLAETDPAAHLLGVEDMHVAVRCLLTKTTYAVNLEKDEAEEVLRQLPQIP